MPTYKPASTRKNTRHPLPIKKGQLDLTKITKTLSAEEGSSRRAAKLLLALGSRQTSEALKQLEPAEVELLMREMTQIDHIDPAEKEALLLDFGELVRKDNPDLRGGIDEARKFLEASFGPVVSQEIIRKINHRDTYADFAFLETVEPESLASVLSREHGQVVSVALSHLKPKIAAEVMRHFPEKFRSDVALRIARSARVRPDTIERVAHILRKKFEQRESEGSSEIGGAESLAQILNYMGRDHENEILDSIKENTPEILEKVKEHLYTFEELTLLSRQEMRLLISRLADDSLLAAALRGMRQEVRLHFFNSMSQNRAADIVDEMERSGPIHVKDIQEARTYILNMAREMDEKGTITIKKEKEEYI